jgi:glucose 1-dehydrogenase
MSPHPLPPVVMPDAPVRKLLVGQKALVTGASSGIGRAVAIGLGAAGADVAVNYITGEDAAQAAAGEIQAPGASAMAIKADVADEAQVQAMFAQMIEAFGTIDILVNNAGLQRDAAFDEMTLAQWNTVIVVNLTGQSLRARGGRSIPRPGIPRRPTRI